MDALTKSAGDDEAGKEKLFETYKRLAKEVKSQYELASPANRPALMKGVTTFLEKVSSTAKDANAIHWVARTFYELGETSTPAKGDLTAEAKGFFDKAAAQYNLLLERAKTDTTIAPNFQIHCRLSLAELLRRQGKFVLAMDQYEEILKHKERNAMLNVQLLAAETYMQWAESGVPTLYVRAVNGGRKNTKQRNKNNIWGYHEIAKRLGKQMTDNAAMRDRFYDTYHQAKLTQAQAYYLFGLKKSEPAERTKNIGYAKSDIRKLLLAHPDMGGQKWRKQYDDLLKKVQTALNEKPDGLAALETEIASAAKTTTPPVETVNSGSGTGGVFTSPNITVPNP
jgi:hypothetical protein